MDLESLMSRAQALIQLERFPEAAVELQAAVASAPDASLPRSLLAICLAELGRREDAIQEAQRAVHLEPDSAYGHYALAWVQNKLGRPKPAAASLEEALRLEPDNAEYLHLAAGLAMGRSEWRKALAFADAGLACDAHHVGCLNARATALNKLGRKSEATSASSAALSVDPANPASHATRGWMQLERGDSAGAISSFRTALRQDADFGSARRGLLDALRSRNPVYRLLLQAMFVFYRLGPQAGVILIFVGIVGQHLCRALAEQYPPLQSVLPFFSVVYFAILFFSAAAAPLFDLLLRLDPQGRVMLTPSERRAASWTGVLILTASASLATGSILDSTVSLFTGGILLILVLPVTSALRSETGHGRLTLAFASAVLALVGFGFLPFIAPKDSAALPALMTSAVISVLGCILFTLVCREQRATA